MWATVEDYKIFLKERHPRDYREMKKDGTLDEYCQHRIDMANEYFVDMADMYSRQHPIDNDATYLERVQWENAALAWAREMANEYLFN